MNKLNKKGFTLIEMLVVIAIIAVLVSIVIPTVTSATDKAAAAANAANMRSIKAEIVTSMLTNDEAFYDFTAGQNGVTTVALTKESDTAKKTLPALKTVDACTTPAWYVAIVNSEVTVYALSGSSYYTIQDFADFAEGKDMTPVTSAPTGVTALS